MIFRALNPEVPSPLKTVAYLFLLLGIASLADTILGLFLGRFVFNLGVLYLLIGQGLLRLKSPWLMWAVACTWLGLISMPIVAVLSIVTPSRLQHFTVFGVNVAHGAPGLALSLAFATFGLLCWQSSVLNSRTVRQRFAWRTSVGACGPST